MWRIRRGVADEGTLRMKKARCSRGKDVVWLCWGFGLDFVKGWRGFLRWGWDLFDLWKMFHGKGVSKMDI